MTSVTLRPLIGGDSLKRSPFYTWQCQHLFGTGLPFCASYNKGFDNIDKMGKRVKEKKERMAGIFFLFLRVRRATSQIFFARPASAN
jgi:hypothetical protein